MLSVVNLGFRLRLPAQELFLRLIRPANAGQSTEYFMSLKKTGQKVSMQLSLLRRLN